MAPPRRVCVTGGGGFIALARQVAPLPRLRRPRHSPRSKYTNLSIPLTQSDKTATYLAVDLDSCAKAFFAIAFVII
jgi:hypothetical protein